MTAAFKHVPIVVLIGARQVGKSTLMEMYPKAGFQAALTLNGQDADTARLFDRLATIEQYLRIYLNNEFDGLLMVDEFQYVNGISVLLKLLTDAHPRLKVLCSGSSSLDIRRNVEESLAGRMRIIEVSPLSFSEYLLFQDEGLFRLHQEVDPADAVLCKPLADAYARYLIYGGMPRAALAADTEEKILLLKDIYDTYLRNDVRRYVREEDFTGFDRLLRILSTQVGGMVNINDLSRDSGLPYRRCEEYLALLEKMYIIRLAEPFYSNRRKMVGKMKKLYFCDLGLRNIIYNSFNEIRYRVDNGAIFENEVYLALLRGRAASETVYFYRTLNGTEVDFIVDGPRRKVAIECKWKHYDKPISIKALNDLVSDGVVDRAYIADMDLYAPGPPATMMPGMFIDRVTG